MFRLSDLAFNRNLPKKNPSAQTMNNRFIWILKIFKWGPDADKALDLEVLKLKVDHRLVREVSEIDVEIIVKIQFFMSYFVVEEE
ncbi:hypothetical protein V6N13_048680 [Hibiscus sabdariffa]|uniref:Uncharacterized protein n=1 Tax=Hibiscus sabdariffa TaxID=183260 RepID=A0ABR2DIV5_9ROSI